MPVFPGTNCDYDSAKAWRNAGAEVRTTIFRNLTEQDVIASIDEMVTHLRQAHILMLALLVLFVKQIQMAYLMMRPTLKKMSTIVSCTITRNGEKAIRRTMRIGTNGIVISLATTRMKNSSQNKPVL